MSILTKYSELNRAAESTTKIDKVLLLGQIHTGREAQTQPNGTWCEWECSHWTQATEKELQARKFVRSHPVWIGLQCVWMAWFWSRCERIELVGMTTLHVFCSASFCHFYLLNKTTDDVLRLKVFSFSFTFWKTLSWGFEGVVAFLPKPEKKRKKKRKQNKTTTTTNNNNNKKDSFVLGQ